MSRARNLARMSHAVVIMSGGDAVSPFTTPDAACRSGLAAGNTDTALREFLLGRGIPVYTAPAQNGRGVVQDPPPDSFGAFADQPEVLDEMYTVNSDGDIDLAGEHLTRFLGLLNDRYGVGTVDLVGHSNGGLFARAAVRCLRLLGSPVRVRSLVTLGSPWMGSFPLRWAFGEVPDEALAGHDFTNRLFPELKQRVDEGDLGLARENTYRYLVGPGRWNEHQVGELDDIDVLLVAGTWFQVDGGDPELWPHDGLVSRFSAVAEGLPAQVAPRRTTRTFPVTHSIFISDLVGEPWETGMTWNPDVLSTVGDFLAGLD